MSYQLRCRKDINWKRLHDGGSIPRSTRIKPVQFYHLHNYDAERLIVRKTQNSKNVNLVKWVGYHVEESTWEPESHLSEYLIGSYLNPTVSQERLNSAAFHFEDTIQKRLRSRNSLSYVNFDLDVYRYCFGTDKSVLLNKDGFYKLPLSSHWYYNINQLGRGIQLSFPIRCQPKVLMKKTHIYADGETSVQSVPTERILITSAVDGLQFLG